MTGDIAAAGELVEAGMIARAVEPHAGEGTGTAGALCLNCGTRLLGAHCHRCGQSGHVHRTAAAIGHELAHGVFHFEGKIWRTLPMLVLHPGALTRRYVAGERARFVSPLAIFLFSVFLLFSVLAQLPGWHLGGENWIGTAGVAQAREAVAADRGRADARIADMTRDLARARAARHPDADVIARTERRLAKLTHQRAQLDRAVRGLPALGGDADVAASLSGDWIASKWRHAKANPQLLLYKLKSSAYKFSWTLIPISLPFIWLLFPFRRDVGVYDHAVFATYSLSFMSLFAVALALLGAAGVSGGWLVPAALLVPPFHLYRQFKGAYRLGRAGAIWRTWWMLGFAGLTSALFVLLLLYLGTSE